MRQMAFSNPVFREKGLLNCTVRNGVFWSNLKIGEWVLMYGKGIKRLGQVRKILICSFDLLKKSDIRYEHDEKCKELKGLYKVMRGLYPKFTLFSIVTAVYFEMGEQKKLKSNLIISKELTG